MTGKKRGRPPKQVIIMNSQECENSATDSAKIAPSMADRARLSHLVRRAKTIARRTSNDADTVQQLSEITDKVLKELKRGNKISTASASQLGILAAVLIDKKRLILGKSTENHTIVNVHEAGDRTISALDRLTQAIRGQSPRRLELAESVDTDAIPVK